MTVRQQLLLQRAQQLVEVSRLAAVRRRRSTLQLIAVLLQLAKGLILHGANTDKELPSQGEQQKASNLQPPKG